MKLTKSDKKYFNEMMDRLSVEKKEEIGSKIQESLTYYSCAILEVETKLRVLDKQFSLEKERNPIESIKSRVKSIDSIVDKMIRKNLKFDSISGAEALNDIAGVRVICSFVDDIYMLADCLAMQDDIKIVRIKDYIKSPKENGYRSLHLLIEIPIFLKNGKKNMKVEIQLRTIAMELWANLEHRLRYKKNISEEKERLTEKELLECAQISATLDEKMYRIKNVIENDG